MAIIEVKGLGKKYNGNAFYSLENATFTIEEGDIIGLVGKNGSGKSTLLKILAKSQNPTEGTVFFNGRDIFKEDNILKDFGIMIEPVFFPQISVEENLKLYLKIHKKEQYQDNIEKILKLVGLWEAKDRKPIDFSFWNAYDYPEDLAFYKNCIPWFRCISHEKMVLVNETNFSAFNELKKIGINFRLINNSNYI